MGKFVKGKELNFDEIVKNWKNHPNLWMITQWHNKFRLIKSSKENIKLKVEITPEDVSFLINKLKLEQIKSTIYKHGSTWKNTIQL